MQMKKAGVVAAGALATVAVMGAPAAAAAAPAPHADASAFTKTSSLDMARGGWSNPWDQNRQGLVAIGSGSAVNALAWQLCGSAGVAGIGLTVDVDPNTLISWHDAACNNGNILLGEQEAPALIGVLNDTAVSIATWQACGSTVGAGVIAITAAVQAPNTVYGPCRNGNIVITGREHGNRDHEDHGYKSNKHSTESTTIEEATKAKAADPVSAQAQARAMGQARNGFGGFQPWDIDQTALLTIGDGSAVQIATWQACGSGAVMGVGAVVGIDSPNTVYGDCDNANVWIDQPEWSTSLISVLDNTSVNIAPFQFCGSDAVGGAVLNVSLTSPDTVFGSCNNANVVIK